MPDFATDDKRQIQTTAQTQDDYNSGVGRDTNTLGNAPLSQISFLQEHSITHSAP